MPYIVGEACIDCKYTSCVDVCPVSCFYEGENFLVINPDECIDCSACEPECPTSAIFADHDVPDGQEPFAEINAVFSGAKEPGDADTSDWPEHITKAASDAGFDVWPNITDSKDPMDDADEQAKITAKMDKFNPAAGG